MAFISRGLEIALDEAELKELHDFEEDCMDDLSLRKHHVGALGQNQQMQQANKQYV